MSGDSGAVLIDLADTLAATQAEILRYCNSRLATPLREEQITPGYREDGANAEYQRCVDEFLLRPDLVARAAPFPWGLSALQRLHENGFELHIASARKENLHAVTFDWLRRNEFADFIHTVHGRRADERGADFKRRVAELVAARVAFDDTYSVIAALDGIVAHRYLLDRPWNRLPVPDGAIRAGNIEAAVDDLLTRALP